MHPFYFYYLTMDKFSECPYKYQIIKFDCSIGDTYNIFFKECCISRNNIYLPKEVLQKTGKEILDCAESIYKEKQVCNIIGKVCKLDFKNIKGIEFGHLFSCNLRCITCRDRIISQTKEEIEWAWDFISKFRGFNLIKINPCLNGEVFLHKKFLYDWISSLSKEDTQIVEIITNATLINDEDVEKLKNLNNKNGVQIQIYVSVDGINKTSYSNVRRNDYFEKVITNIKNLKNAGLIFGVIFTVSKQNVQYLPLVQAFWRKYDIPVSTHFAGQSPESTVNFELSDETKLKVQKYITAPL